MNRERTPKVRVRCLGVGEEHTFMSADPVGNRICDRCRQVLNAVHTNRCNVPVRTFGEGK